MAKKKAKPIDNGSGGRDKSGRFTKGNSLSKGNHNVEIIAKARELKKALINAVNDKDIEKIAKKLVYEAKKGNIPAIKELFDRLWGRAKQEIEGNINLIPTDEKPLTEEELLERLQKVKHAGNGIDTKSIEGNGNSH